MTLFKLPMFVFFFFAGTYTVKDSLSEDACTWCFILKLVHVGKKVLMYHFKLATYTLIYFPICYKLPTHSLHKCSVSSNIKGGG